MNKKFFLGMHLFIFGLFFVTSLDAKSWKKLSSRECQLETLIKIKCIESNLSAIFSFLDQSADIVDNLFNYQELMYDSVILPMYREHNGKYKKMIQSIKRSKRLIGITLQKAKKTEIVATDEFIHASNRFQQLDKFLLFTKKNSLLMGALWDISCIDVVHGKLIQMHKSLPQKDGHVIVLNGDEQFQKELLFAAYNSVSLYQRRHAMANYVRNFIQKDLKACKKLYDKARRSIGGSFAADRLKSISNDLDSLNASIQKMSFYTVENRRFLKEKRINLICLLLNSFSRVGAFVYSKDQ